MITSWELLIIGALLTIYSVGNTRKYVLFSLNFVNNCVIQIERRCGMQGTSKAIRWGLQCPQLSLSVICVHGPNEPGPQLKTPNRSHSRPRKPSVAGHPLRNIGPRQRDHGSVEGGSESANTGGHGILPLIPGCRDANV